MSRELFIQDNNHYFFELRLLARTALHRLCLAPFFLDCLPLGSLCLRIPPSSSSPSPSTNCEASLDPNRGLPCNASLLPLILYSLRALAVD